MAEYIIKKTSSPFGPLSGAFDPDELIGLNHAQIAHYAWDKTGYRPDARAYVGFDGSALLVTLCAREQTIRAEESLCGGRVFEDSCLEFFFAPFPGQSAQYVNIEVNPAGTAHIGVGAGRHSRRVFSAVPDGFGISASAHAGGWWAVRYRVPNAFLREAFGMELRAGDRFRGNFYKCDESIHPHHGTWSAVLTEEPDFHRPEFFGWMAIER